MNLNNKSSHGRCEFWNVPQDKLVCEYLLESQKKYGWPLQVMATTGKNSKKELWKLQVFLEICSQLICLYSQ